MTSAHAAEKQPAHSPERARFQPTEKEETAAQTTLSEKKTVRQVESVKSRWKLGILEDQETDEVPGTVVLLSKTSTRNIPLGLHHESTRGRTSTRHSVSERSNRSPSIQKKKTPDGQIILDPQPDDSLNDPLNWPSWRRNAALLSLGFYCMLGGGMTPILAAGFTQVADDLNVSYADVARTTGLYMMGMGIGSVIFSPTAILFGKRPVYLLSALLFVVSSIWCAAAPNYAHLVTARIFQGIAISPVECLPSATIAEIFFLHERAFRIGIYTLLLLGGKNLIPLISAAIIQSLSWRWVFWVVAIAVGFGGILLFLFVSETFWDRTPRPKALSRRSTSAFRRFSTSLTRNMSRQGSRNLSPGATYHTANEEINHHVFHEEKPSTQTDGTATARTKSGQAVRFTPDDSEIPHLHNLNSPYYTDLEKSDDYLQHHATDRQSIDARLASDDTIASTSDQHERKDKETSPRRDTTLSYTPRLQQAPVHPWIKTLKPWNGRLNKKASWWRAAIRPGILLAYPAVLWSALVYSLSVGWLIVLSESVSHIYGHSSSYNFTSMQIGMVYLSPFIGGVLGTAVAGKVSDIIVRFMARRNDGIYEPEYRLVMALPIAISTAIGLMGFGWSAEEKDAWIVPTVFFGIISFGCSLGSTTAITFCVDSYRQYAGEALVTLNFSKNIFHGLVWSLFFPQWLVADGSKDVFIAIGCIQLACMLLTIPMYIYGKRARMWTVRKGMMERF